MTADEKNAFIARHLPLVPEIAAQIVRNLPPCFELDDLIGAGYLGLVLASTGYAPGRIRTTTEQAEASYARTRIRGTILDTVRKDYPYVHKRCPWTEILSERVETPDYIAEFFGITVADIVFGPLAAMKPSEFNITPDS